MDKHDWKRSSFCSGGGNNCVEVAVTGSDVTLRESESPESCLTTSRSALVSLIRSVKAEALQLPPG